MVDSRGQSKCCCLYDDFLTPPRCKLAGRRRRQPDAAELRGQPPRFAAEQMHAQLRHAIAPDGERIPYFVVARRDASHDGQRPTLLYGCGGFAVPMTPFYLGALGRQWLEQGGCLCSAARGGGEFGLIGTRRRWPSAGKWRLMIFLAIARQLIADGVTARRGWAFRAAAMAACWWRRR